MSIDNDTKVIGYFAYSSDGGVVCDGDACVIAGSDSDLRTYLSRMGAEESHCTLKKTRFGEIMRGISLGGAYAFDEAAYNRFYPLAQREGIELGPMDFSRRVEGKHFIKVSFKRTVQPD